MGRWQPGTQATRDPTSSHVSESHILLRARWLFQVCPRGCTPCLTPLVHNPLQRALWFCGSWCSWCHHHSQQATQPCLPGQAWSGTNPSPQYHMHRESSRFTHNETLMDTFTIWRPVRIVHLVLPKFSVISLLLTPWFWFPFFWLWDCQTPFTEFRTYVLENEDRTKSPIPLTAATPRSNMLDSHRQKPINLALTININWSIKFWKKIFSTKVVSPIVYINNVFVIHIKLL